MQTTVTITPQWQIYIPTSIRQALQLSTAGQATIEASGGKIIITPHTSPVLELIGKYHARHTKSNSSVENIREIIDYGAL